MLRYALSLNRTGKAGGDDGKSVRIPFNPEFAMPAGQFVTLVTSTGELAIQKDVMNYELPDSPRPVYAVFYTQKEYNGKRFNCIDMIMFADSIDRAEFGGREYTVVLGHNKAAFGSYASYDPQCMAYYAILTGSLAITAQEQVFIPTFFLEKEGAPSSMWTASVDMAQSSAWSVCPLTFNNGSTGPLSINFARAPLGSMQIKPLWFPYISSDINRAKYPVAVGSNGTSLYWACWRPISEEPGHCVLQAELFAQDSLAPVGASVSDVSSLHMVTDGV